MDSIAQFLRKFQMFSVNKTKETLTSGLFQDAEDLSAAEKNQLFSC